MIFDVDWYYQLPVGRRAKVDAWLDAVGLRDQHVTAIEVCDESGRHLRVTRQKRINGCLVVHGNEFVVETTGLYVSEAFPIEVAGP